jgi:SH3-like domain-containing protein
MAAALCLMLLPAGAHADSSGQPRYVSLRHETVHVRAGPGQEYPIRWIFKRQGLPVQVLRDYEHWRLIRDSAGDEGWVHQAGLSARRTALVTGAVRAIRTKPDETSEPVARLEPGVVARLERCDQRWCRVSVQKYTGWLRQQEIWGVRPDETFD